MGAQRLRRRIVWLLAAAAFGVAAILGASAATADDTGAEVPSSPDGSTNSSEWN